MTNKYDLHTHFWTNFEAGRASLERTPRTIENMLNAIKRKGLDGIAFANYGSDIIWKDAYEKLSEKADKREGTGIYKLVKELSNAMIFADKGGRLLSIIKAEEIPAIKDEKEMHVMAVGLDKNIIIPSRLSLGETLRKIKNLGAVSIADHYNGARGIGRKNVLSYTECFLLDSWERFNANFTHKLLSPCFGINPTKEEADKLEEETGTYGIAVSDCHHSREVGNGYIELENDFDFSSEDNLKDSIKEIIRKGKFKAVEHKGNSIISVLSHIGINIYDIARSKVGWTKLDYI